MSVGTRYFAVGLLVAIITTRAARGCPSECECFGNTVSCQFEGLTEVPVLEFSLRPESLNLANNDFDHLDNLTFVPAASYAPYLRVLRFSHNKIEHIRTGAFDTLKNLEAVFLDNNLLTDIEDYAFLGFDLGITLDLSYNRIQDISTRAFVGLNNIGFLFLNNNAGKLNLYGGIFKDLTQLNHTLELSYSGIENIPPGTFEGLEIIDALVLSGNQLAAIEDFAFSGLETFDGILKLDNNRIQHLSTHAFAGLSWLLELRLFNNVGLILYSGVFKDLTRLSLLDLSSCAIEVIPPGSFEGLDNLGSLILSGNLLTEVADFVFSGLENFAGFLLLNQNKIQHISTKAFVGLGNLSYLDLSDNDYGNGIILYRGVFKDLTQLKGLVLSDSGIETIPSGTFKGLDDLETLRLNGNKLNRIGRKDFSELISLRILTIQYNDNLSCIAASAFDSLTKLESLILDTNKFGTLSAYTVGVLDDLMTYHSLSQLTLYDNPWHCDCDLLPLSKLIQPAHLTEVGASLDGFPYLNFDNNNVGQYYIPLCSNLADKSVPNLYSNSTFGDSCETRRNGRRNRFGRSDRRCRRL